MSLFRRKFFKVLSVYLLINLFAELFFPTVSYALTSGPQQPEFSSFEPVSTTNMVSEFTGDFTYNLPMVNVPGPNGGGYALSLSYHSGTSPEEEASWVGYGWTLNPGSINRGKKGFPDDYKGDEIEHVNRVPKNWTASLGVSGGLEFFSVDGPSILGVSASKAIRYNNYKGYGSVTSIGLAIYGGLASLDYSVSEEGHSFSADVNPAAFFTNKKSKTFRDAKNKLDKCGRGDLHKARNTYKAAKSADSKRRSKQNQIANSALAGGGSQYGIHFLAEDLRPSSVQGYTGSSFNFTFSLGVNPAPLEIGLKGGLTGSYSEQETYSSTKVNAYGFLYQSDAVAADEYTRMMDYSVEKEGTYNRRDKFLSIPYQSPDLFNVTGEGLGGAFRLYNSNVGHFFTRRQKSNTTIFNGGASVALGLDIEPFTGFNIGLGFHNSEVKKWNDDGNTSTYSYANGIGSKVENTFMRFNGDMGGNVIFSESDEAYQAGVMNTRKLIGVKKFAPQISSLDIKTQLSERNERSSYIGYHTNKEMVESTINEGRDIYLKSFTKDNSQLTDDAWDMVNRNAGAIDSRIGELATYNEEGNRYIYGLPVYASNETEMSYSVRDNGAPTLINNHIAYKDVSGDLTTTKIGEVRNAPYTTSYLLTEITTPDYIDRTFDGPTWDDFGGWTKFNYDRVKDNQGNYKYWNSDKSSTSNWYKWRFPYNGLFYSRGQMCDPRDDMGQMSSGSREVYYMKSIETKTHIAYFITNHTNLSIPHSSGANIILQGSGQKRKDALGAAIDDLADNDKSGKDQNQDLERLEKIVVFAKDASNSSVVTLTGKPLKTVHLEYSYEAWKNIPNNLSYDATGNNIDPESGKLTLKKVWFEYEGIVNAKITPYEFLYQYDLNNKVTSSDLLTNYNDSQSSDKDIIGYGQTLNQTPNYDPSGLDAWGNWGYDAANRSNVMRSWLYQGGNTADFDPAAWQLKVIKLPAGGEIHVQYEQHEYQQVQDKEALAMISLGSGTSGKLEAGSDNKYYLNLNDIDLDMDNDGSVTQTEKDAYAAKCSLFVTQNKIHFKFLYQLEGGSVPSLSSCGSEFITGYVSATGVYTDQTGIYVSLDQNGYTVPRRVCMDYYTRNVGGLNLSDNCDISREPISSGDKIATVKGLVSNLANDYKATELNCKQISLSNSYFRLPLMKAKKGGGVRVKRILMYDRGLESNGSNGVNGDEVLYGTEYIYKNADGTSSGVATNEPSSIREENALISFLAKRAPQKLIGKVISGTDKDQFEGPIGEYLLPGASVGYSRVISKNIHSGKSGTGYKVSEFYTFHDPEYAFSNSVKNTEVDDHALDYLYLPAIWVNIKVDNRWASQGYSFTMNSMHGRQKRIAMYGGEYTEGNEDNNYKSFEEVYEYYKPGEKVPVMDEFGTISPQYVGKEMDVTMEMKSVEDIQNDGSIQVDFSTGIALFIPLFQFSIFPYYSYTERCLRTHIINKVTHYPAIVKSVITTQDGIVHVKKNKAFDKSTGQTVATIDYDGYDGLTLEKSPNHKGAYTNYTIPAHLIYKNFGQKAKNQAYTQSLSATITTIDNNSKKYSFDLPVGSTLITDGLLVAGDLIKLRNSSTVVALYHISGFSGNTVLLQGFSLTSSISSFTDLEIVNSGYTNQLNLVAGSLMTYGTDYTNGALPPSPITVSSGSASLNNLNNVLSASVKTFYDYWGGNTAVNSDYGINTATNPNDYETARSGKWRENADYTYKTEINDAVLADNRIYNAGTFKTFTGFNYSSLSSNDLSKWLRTNLVTAYSPNGNALQEENILGTQSTAKFSHNESVPSIIAHNASYTSVIFKSFEDVAGVNSSVAHSGSNSMEVQAGDFYSPGAVILDGQIRNYGLSTKFWMKTSDQFDLTYLQGTITKGNKTVRGSLKQIARVGEWTLIEVKFKEVFNVFTNGDSLTINISNTFVSKIWLDDIRVQPLDAEAACYVYDKQNLRLLATFDDQHFGMYYQYNAEGKLVRKLVETERGLKTITETQYNTSVK